MSYTAENTTKYPSHTAPVISLWCTLKYCFWLNVKWWVNIAVTHVTPDLVTELPLTTEVSTAFLQAVVTSTFIHYHQFNVVLRRFGSDSETILCKKSLPPGATLDFFVASFLLTFSVCTYSFTIYLSILPRLSNSRNKSKTRFYKIFQKYF